jgi:hypothetical protein
MNTSWFTLRRARLEFNFSGVQGRLFPVLGLRDEAELKPNFCWPFKWQDANEATETSTALAAIWSVS